jgi:uncharacterized protein YndB with AHSA1/START domain
MEQPIIVEQTYNAPVEKIWNALTDRDQMEKWYFNLSGFRAEVGFEFEFPGQGAKGENYLHLCKVIEATPLKKLSYSWKYADHAGDSLVTFELFPEGDKTRVKLTHAGVDTFPATSPDFARSSFEAGWTHILQKSLKEFVEKNSW